MRKNKNIKRRLATKKRYRLKSMKLKELRKKLLKLLRRLKDSEKKPRKLKLKPTRLPLALLKNNLLLTNMKKI